MIAAYDTFRDSLEWRSSLGDSEYPGVPNLADAVTVPGRKQERLHDLGGDTVSDVEFALFPEHKPKPKDTLDGAEVLRVASVKDSAGNVLWWVAYARA